MKTKDKTKTTWHEGKVVKGSGMGRKLGFPTINIDNASLFEERKRGVYLCKVKIRNKFYCGLLYFGPRLIQADERDSLEIFVFDFNKDVYGEVVKFSPLGFLRKPYDFAGNREYRKQLEEDILKAKKMLRSS